MSTPPIEISPGIVYPFKSDPFPHQLAEWTFSHALIARAILWEQGTGKSKLTIDTACALFLLGRIDAVIVVAPNGVHRNWVEDEIPAHVPDVVMRQSRAHHFQSDRADTKWHKAAVKAVLNHSGLSWFAISYEAFMTAAGKRALIDMFDKRRVFYVLDEAHYIKTPTAARTKSILRSAKYAAYRRILTGTPIAQGPFDLYSEIQFLDEHYWFQAAGLGSFTEFRTHFGIMKKVYNPHLKSRFNPETERWEKCAGGYVDTVEGYRRLPELNALIQPIATRLTKEEVLPDLPAKLRTKRYFAMSPEQRRLYKQMRDEALVWLELGGLEKEAAEVAAEAAPAGVCATCGGQQELNFDGYLYPCPDCRPENAGAPTEGGTPVIANLVITKLLRLQQIACGYLPTDNEEEPRYIIPGPNPRLEALLELIEGTDQKVIVWARFQYDITLIMDALTQRGISAVRYDGAVSDDDRAEAKARFKGFRALYSGGQVVGREEIPPEKQAQVFVANPAVGATGLTLTEARTVAYYSNSYKLIDRLQSEDRAHRIGQHNAVLYVDLVAEDSIDEKIVEALRNKFNIASQITGDRLREWL